MKMIEVVYALFGNLNETHGFPYIPLNPACAKLTKFLYVEVFVQEAFRELWKLS